jgi:hypothetical protein
MRAPIAGMSLTKTPGNSPYEHPPLYNTPEKALAFYFQTMDDEEKLDDIMFALDSGVPLEGLVDAMTSVGAMEGYHSIDVKMLISPPLHEYISALAEAAGIEFVEMMGPSKEERIGERDKARMKMLMQKAFEEGDAVSPEVTDKAEEALAEPMANEAEMPLIQRRQG